MLYRVDQGYNYKLVQDLAGRAVLASQLAIDEAALLMGALQSSLTAEDDSEDAFLQKQHADDDAGGAGAGGEAARRRGGNLSSLSGGAAAGAGYREFVTTKWGGGQQLSEKCEVLGCPCFTFISSDKDATICQCSHGRKFHGIN